MKSFRRLCILTGILLVSLFFFSNLLLLKSTESEGRYYRVEISRAASFIEQSSLEELNLEEYPSIVNIVIVEDESQLFGEDEDYLIRKIDEKLYRFDYVVSDADSRLFVTVNLILGLVSVFIIVILLAIYYKALKPLKKIVDVPYDLSKGNDVQPMKDLGDGLFGRFGWGMNLLRENIQQQKNRELQLLAEKKKLILSISHDIKIPLSAIKLYAKAMEKGLYDEQKRQQIAGKIDEKANEIAMYVSKIVEASSEDFLALQVQPGEFYLSSLMKQLQNYYQEKLSLLSIDFKISNYDDILLKGDEHRSLEVLQNIVENAVKYGDGLSIGVEISREEDCCLISIRNSGCTLSDDELPHIFDSFWRGSNSKANEGSGLGLYISKTLMHKMNGNLYAQRKKNDMIITAVFEKA